MTDDISRLHRETGAAWDLAARLYERDQAADVEFLRNGGNSLLPPERELLSGLPDWCDRAIHLQCAGGKDTLSLLAQGAREVIGIDISPRMVASAQARSDALQANATWICCDVLQAPSDLDGTADLVYTGRGALPWIMDLSAWARTIRRLLKPGGRLLVFEGHPLDWIWDTDSPQLSFHPTRHHYFSDQPEGGERWPAPYLARQPDVDLQHTPIHERQWTLGQTINALLAAGLPLLRFDEHPDLYWNQFPNLSPEILARLPHTFSLLAHNPQQAPPEPTPCPAC